jgi:hypothetical protein
MATRTFMFNTPAIGVTNLVSTDRALGIRSLQVAAPFAGCSLVYRTGEFSYVRDPYAELLEIPAEELLAPVRASFRASGNFKTVVDGGSALKPDTLVEISVNQMYGDFRETGRPQAILAMQFTFFAAANGMPGKVLLQREYSRSIPLAEPSAAALMKGWDQALGEILADVSVDLQHSSIKKAK